MAAIVSLAGARLNAAPRPAAAALLPPLHRCHRRRFVPLASGAASVPGDSGSSSSSNGASVPDPAISGNGATASPAAAWEQQQEQPAGGLFGWLRSQREKSGELRKRLAALGLAAVLAYGLFDGVSYTIAFSLAFLGYEARTGLNPTQNVADIVKICILMWAGNNVTRPFRLAGAAALAPFMDRLMERMQARLGLKNKGAAFAICVVVVAGVCFSILGALFFSRWVRG